MSALYGDMGLVQARSDLWINPRAILYVEGFEEGVIINLNGSTRVISREDWAAIRPYLVTLSAQPEPTPQTVTHLMSASPKERTYLEDVQRYQRDIDAMHAAEKSAEAQAVDEIIAEEDSYFPEFDIVGRDLMAEIDASEAARAAETDLSRLKKVVQTGNFVILDTETTGLNGDAEICQIAIIDHEGNTLLNTLVKPTKPIPADASRIHKITQDMVKDAPSWADINVRVWKLLYGRTTVVYNADYDFKMIRQSEKAGKPFALSDWHVMKRECAMLAYAEYRGIWNDYHGNYKWHKLADAAARVGYTLPDGMKAHDALADCLMTLAVCRKLAGL